MSPVETKPIPKLPYARAFDVIWHNENLSMSEKVVLTEVCRYWPKAYYGSNSTISANTGLSIRHIQRTLKALSTGPRKRHTMGLGKRRAYIDRGYGHTVIDGKLYTSRVILPICLPGSSEVPDAPADLQFNSR